MGSRRTARRVDNSTDVWKGLAAGLVGGLIASWTMNQFQALLSKASEGDEKSQGGRGTQNKQSQNNRYQ